MKPQLKWLNHFVTSTGWPNLVLAVISVVLAGTVVILLRAILD
jgi:hypothetical protein